MYTHTKPALKLVDEQKEKLIFLKARGPGQC